ncbi:hypothetical protein BC830DRAFT_1077652 [Chytriomyces sp. MP71]|nr:hypothetical protein BC830DRAFT_1077652 [Chytriomyces sp. MP71]
MGRDARTLTLQPILSLRSPVPSDTFEQPIQSTATTSSPPISVVTPSLLSIRAVGASNSGNSASDWIQLNLGPFSAIVAASLFLLVACTCCACARLKQRRLEKGAHLSTVFGSPSIGGADLERSFSESTEGSIRVRSPLLDMRTFSALPAANELPHHNESNPIAQLHAQQRAYRQQRIQAAQQNESLNRNAPPQFLVSDSIGQYSTMNQAAQLPPLPSRMTAEQYYEYQRQCYMWYGRYWYETQPVAVAGQEGARALSLTPYTQMALAMSVSSADSGLGASVRTPSPGIAQQWGSLDSRTSSATSVTVDALNQGGSFKELRRPPLPPKRRSRAIMSADNSRAAPLPPPRKQSSRSSLAASSKASAERRLSTQSSVFESTTSSSRDAPSPTTTTTVDKKTSLESPSSVQSPSTTTTSSDVLSSTTEAPSSTTTDATTKSRRASPSTTGTDDTTETSASTSTTPTTSTTLSASTTSSSIMSSGPTLTSSASISPLNPDNSNGGNQPWAATHGGLLAVIILVSLAGLAALGFVAWFCHRRKRDHEIDGIVNFKVDRERDGTLLQSRNALAAGNPLHKPSVTTTGQTANYGTHSQDATAVPSHSQVDQGQAYNYYYQPGSTFPYNQKDASYAQQGYYMPTGYPMDAAALMEQQQVHYGTATDSPPASAASSSHGPQPPAPPVPEKENLLFDGITSTSHGGVPVPTAAPEAYIEKERVSGSTQADALPLKLAATLSEPVVSAAADPVAFWTVQHVCAWMLVQGIGSAETVAIVREQEIDGRALLLLTEQDVVTVLKLAQGEERIKFYMALAEARGLPPPNPSSLPLLG